MIKIGIDPGVKTGLAVWDTNKKELLEVKTLKIHEALELCHHYVLTAEKVKIRVEDARKRKWFGGNAQAKIQGAGSVKRDCKIWDDFLKDIGADYEMIHPVRGATKLDAEKFKLLTSYVYRTSEHARDAALLVFGS